MQDAGCKMQDARCKMQDAARRMQDAGCRMQREGCRQCMVRRRSGLMDGREQCAKGASSARRAVPVPVPEPEHVPGFAGQAPTAERLSNRRPSCSRSGQAPRRRRQQRRRRPGSLEPCAQRRRRRRWRPNLHAIGCRRGRGGRAAGRRGEVGVRRVWRRGLRRDRESRGMQRRCLRRCLQQRLRQRGQQRGRQRGRHRRPR